MFFLNKETNLRCLFCLVVYNLKEEIIWSSNMLDSCIPRIAMAMENVGWGKKINGRTELRFLQLFRFTLLSHPWPMVTHFLYLYLRSHLSGCGSVGRAVASDTRGPRFESNHRQKFINIEQLLYTVNCVLKRRKIKKKRPGMAHFFKKKTFLLKGGGPLIRYILHSYNKDLSNFALFVSTHFGFT